MIDLRSAVPVGAAVVLAVVLAGCGAGDTKTGTVPSSTEAAPVAPTQPPPPPLPPLSSLPDGPVAPADLPVIVSNRTYTGEVDGQTYAEYYGFDRTLRGKNGDYRYTGTWAVQGDKLCFTYPESGNTEPTCYSVIKQGDVITWVGADGQGFEVNSVEGNPQGL